MSIVITVEAMCQFLCGSESSHGEGTVIIGTLHLGLHYTTPRTPIHYTTPRTVECVECTDLAALLLCSIMGGGSHTDKLLSLGGLKLSLGGLKISLGGLTLHIGIQRWEHTWSLGYLNISEVGLKLSLSGLKLSLGGLTFSLVGLTLLLVGLILSLGSLTFL